MKKIPDNISCLHTDDICEITDVFRCEDCGLIFATDGMFVRFPKHCPNCEAQFEWKDK